MKKACLFVLVIMSLLITSAVYADDIAHDYTGSSFHYAQKDEIVLFDGVLTGTQQTFDGSYGLTSFVKTANLDGPFKIEVAHEEDIDQNVLKIQGLDSGDRTNSELKLDNFVPWAEEDTHTSVAIHIDMKVEAGKIFNLQFFGRPGASGSNTNLNGGPVLGIKWQSGMGTHFYFGNSSNLTSNVYEVDNLYKRFDDFVSNRWYNFVIVFNNNGSKEEDTMDIYVDGNHVFTRTGLNGDFNNNIQTMILQQQKDAGTENIIKIANLYATKDVNHVSALSVQDLTVDNGDVFELIPTLIGENAVVLPTFLNYEVEISDSTALSYNATTKKFTALRAAEDVTVTFTAVDDTLSPAPITASIDILQPLEPTGLVRINLLTDDIRMVVGSTLELSGLFRVEPTGVVDETINYTFADENQSFVEIVDGRLVALEEGTVTLIATSNYNNDLEQQVDIHVYNGIFEGLNDFQITTEFNEPNFSQYQDGWMGRGYATREFGVIHMIEDDLFGVVPRIYGIGGSNAGGSYLFTYLPLASLQANKDYALTGYTRVSSFSSGNHRVDFKLYAATEQQEGFLRLSPVAYYEDVLQISNATVAQNGWVPFETARINLDVLRGADTLVIEMISYNNNLGVDVDFAHVGLVEHDDVELKGIDVTESNIVLDKGSTHQLNVTTYPAIISLDATYQSSNEDVATIDENGLMTAVSVGTAIITVDMEGKTDTLVVTVTSALESITADPIEVNIHVTATQTVELLMLPIDYTDTLIASYSVLGIASHTLVNNILTITGQAIGQTILTIYSEQNPDVSVEITINIEDVPVTAIDVLHDNNLIESIELGVGQTYELTFVVRPITVIDKTITLSAADDAVFSMDGHTLTMLTVGTTKLIVEAGDYRREIDVTVTQATPSDPTISIDETNYTITIDEELQLEASLSVDGQLVYTSIDESVATVDQNGLVTAVGQGTTTIIISYQEIQVEITIHVTSNQTASLMVTVIIVSVLAVALLSVGAVLFVKKPWRK